MRLLVIILCPVALTIAAIAPQPQFGTVRRDAEMIVMNDNDNPGNDSRSGYKSHESGRNEDVWQNKSSQQLKVNDYSVVVHEVNQDTYPNVYQPPSSPPVLDDYYITELGDIKQRIKREGEQRVEEVRKEEGEQEGGQEGEQEGGQGEEYGDEYGEEYGEGQEGGQGEVHQEGVQGGSQADGYPIGKQGIISSGEPSQGQNKQGKKVIETDIFLSFFTAALLG